MEDSMATIPKSPDVEMLSSFEKSGDQNDLSLRDESLADSFKSMHCNLNINSMFFSAVSLYICLFKYSGLYLTNKEG
jgi:hypothetical protein